MKKKEFKAYRLLKHLRLIGWAAVGIFIISLATNAPTVTLAQEHNGHPFGEPGQLEFNLPTGKVAPDSPAATPVPAPLKRGFYLTKYDYLPSQALTACAKGYHMASIWELLDVSTLNYHYKHPYAFVGSDSGNGPPSFLAGWIRTGFFVPSGGNVPGAGNCKAWTSNDINDYGTTVNLRYDWTVSPTLLGPWEARIYSCGSGAAPVWCVSDLR